jgi:hypothetical protein
MTIWCLFSIANDYNQPKNNLECFWASEPSIQDIAKAIGVDFKGDDNILGIVGIYQGESKRFFGADYRIEQVQSNNVLKND